MYKISIAEKAQKKLGKLSLQWQSKVSRAIGLLATNPFVGKKLHGNYEGSYAVRAWPYRIIYTIDNHRVIVNVLDLGHRKDIYR